MNVIKKVIEIEGPFDKEICLCCGHNYCLDGQ